MAARITEVRDAVAERVRSWWGPTGADEVVALYRVQIDADELVGRKVYVIPTTFAGVPADRGEDQDDYTFAVIVAEKYPSESAGDPAEAWVDERVAWCERLLQGVLGSARGTRILAASATGGLWPEAAELTAVYDVEELAERKLFLSVLTVTYREHAAHAPEV